MSCFKVESLAIPVMRVCEREKGRERARERKRERKRDDEDEDGEDKENEDTRKCFQPRINRITSKFDFIEMI